MAVVLQYYHLQVMANNTSKHILNTASTLLGFCLFVITSVHSSNFSATSIIDEFTSGIALVLIFSCLLSFYSLQNENSSKSVKPEKIAEMLFGLALVGILIIVLLLMFRVIV